MIDQSMLYILSNIQELPVFYVYILIFIVIIVIILLVYFLSTSKKSNFSDQNPDEQKKYAMNAAILLYNESFAGREKGQEDKNWNDKLYNKELNVYIDENFFKNVFATPDNIMYGKWVKLSMPKF
jgi:hypothetical protein